MERPPARPTDNAKPLLELRGLHKRFGSLVVLDGVDLALRKGETTVIIGESGAGKSVILKHMVVLLRPDRGEVWYEGRRIDNLSERDLAPVRKDFGFLFQLSALFDSMTVGQNVAFPLIEHDHLKTAEAREVAEQKLRMVGLADIQDKWPADLSGGQKKRVALARAIALNPKVIFYDEPTTGLDPARSDVINELIIKLSEELCVTSVVVTHDMASVRRVSNRVVMIQSGRFIFDGDFDAIAHAPDPRIRRFVEGRASQEELDSLHVKGAP